MEHERLLHTGIVLLAKSAHGFCSDHHKPTFLGHIKESKTGRSPILLCESFRQGSEFLAVLTSEPRPLRGDHKGKISATFNTSSSD